MRLMIVLFTTCILTACGSEQKSESSGDANPTAVARNQVAQELSTQEQSVVVSQDDALTIARNLADTWLKTYQPQQNAWSWGAGVLMMGMMDLFEVTGEQKYYQYAKAWIDFHLENGYFVTSSDTSIPGYTALRLFEIEGDPKYLEVGHEIWQYLSVEAGRTSEGGLNHLGLISGNQIWVDSLFMIGPFLMKYAEITGINTPYEEYALQFSVFRKNLRDPATGLYRHMYDDSKKTTTPEAPHFWGRGNGWVFVGYQVADNYLPADVKAGLSFSLEEDSEQMLSSLVNSPVENGRFHTIINEPESYLETSAGLLYAYGLYYNMLEKQQVNATQQALAESWLQGAINQTVVDGNGDTLLLGTSYGTSPGTLAYYNQVLKGENVAYGVGLYLLATSTRERVGGLSALLIPTEEPSETYIKPPVPCRGVPCGKFHVARGNFVAAIEQFANDPSSESYFYQAAIETVRLAFDAFYQIDRVAANDLTGEGLIEWVNTQAYQRSNHVSHLLDKVKPDQAFQSTLERLLILESGGQSAIGLREYDLGEVYLFDALAHLVSGVALITGADPSITDLNTQSVSLNQALMNHPWKTDNATLKGLQTIVDALDNLMFALEWMDQETDDQSNDFIPNNVVRLNGTFGIPGLILDTDVRALLLELGLSEQDIEQIDAPGDLIQFLRPIASTLKVVTTLLELII